MRRDTVLRKMEARKSRLDLDATGATASLLCAIHCAIIPLVITLLPLLGLSFLADTWVEWTLMGCSAILGTASLCFGFREHGHRRAFFVLGTGLFLLVLGHIAEERRLFGWMGVAVVVLGGCVVAASHFINQRLCLSCRSCQPKP